MARNRMIKPEFWASETLMRISRDARLLFIGLWNFCDDYGFCINSPRRILGDVFPIDDKVNEKLVSKWLNELIAVNVVVPVDYQGKNLLFIKSWGEHQTVQHKSKRKFIQDDDLEQVITHTLDSHETLVRHYLDSHAPKRKKKEKEESNKDKECLLDCVYLTEEEYNKLVDKYGSEKTLGEYIKILNNYKMSKGKKYDSDYHVMIGWVFKEYQKNNPNGEFYHP